MPGESLLTRNVVFAIIGNTGCGKTKLSIELAKHFSGEVVNADSMQFYKGLDIITNKASIHEQQGVPHHLLSFLDIKARKEYNVRCFSDDCKMHINDLFEHRKLPIITGGTNYYLQNALFSDGLVTEPEVNCSDLQSSKNDLIDEETRLSKLSGHELHAMLQEIDPIIAGKWHPNDQRKILRSILIYKQTGQIPSEIYERQRLTRNARSISDLLLYPVCIFWLYTEPSTLETRLDERVDKMLELGMLNDIQSMFEIYREESQNPDFQMDEGIWQVIGFKEFIPWLEDGATNNKLFNECLERMKISTRQYAKRQTKWIRNKLLKLFFPDLNINNDSTRAIYVLDATNLDEWDTSVGAKAIRLAREFILGDDELISRSSKEFHETESLLKPTTRFRDFGNTTSEWKHFKCDHCLKHDGSAMVFLGERQYKEHCATKKHRNRIKRLNHQRNHIKNRDKD